MKRRALLLLFLAACRPSGGEAPTVPEVPVTLGVVRRDSIVVYLEADGRLISRPDGSALLTAPADGVVRSVRAQLGGRIGAGAVALELDAPDLEAQAATLRAQASVAAANAERQRQLFADGISARRQVEESAAEAEALKAQAAAAESLRQRTRVRSPLNGVVSQLLVRPGERVSAGQPLVEVMDPSQVYASATVPAAKLAGLRPGLDAELALEGSPTAWPARLESVGATIDSLSNTAQVLLRPRTVDAMLRPGLGVAIRIRVAVKRNVLVVPATALVYVGNTPTLFVVGPDSIARARTVVLGARSGETIEVSGEVREGDRIVALGAYGLPDSARVVPSTVDSAAAP
ncbi:MAG: efflux RND transporter periplasmic adaptor subunit [Gemmatimonadales bacterium]